ncbi:PAS domain-containing protein [Aridibaculum aurantiacum]|uniref:PAS domain-containing protein n=1 Tax=Aridibaculum aurantiacum TaxID=2810307 RepID=UPI001A966B10|nr:PAS domain-containing protein [Aridibaculum aurantiacum]
MFNTNSFFDSIFKNAAQNGMMVMTKDGIIEQVNEAFTKAYGYTTEDLQSKHFRILYIEKDQKLLRPEIEVNITNRSGSHSDENYLVHKDGTPIWVTGEAVLVETEEGSCIVKIIQNNHAQKQLERYLLASSDVLDTLFESVQSGLLILDSRVRIIKCNGAFRRIFGLQENLPEGSKVQEIAHPFWQKEEIKKDLRNVLIEQKRLKKEYIMAKGKDEFIRLRIVTKIMQGEDDPSTRLLLVVKELT